MQRPDCLRGPTNADNALVLRWRPCRIKIDLGGSWIHGCEGNPLMKLVEKTNAKLAWTPVDGPAQLRYDGRAISDEVSAAGWT